MPTLRRASDVWLRAASGLVLAGAIAACETTDEEPIGTTDGAVQPGFGGSFAGGPGAGPGGADASAQLDSGFAGGGGTTGGAFGGATGGGATGGFISGGGTTGGFIGGFTAGGFIAGRDAGAGGIPGVDASTPSDAAVSVGDGGDPFAELRQVCVDTINMYRASLNLSPLARANATQENCSDQGAQKDGSTKQAHSSAGGNTTTACRSAGLAAQNTCPGWPVGPRTGNATLADALKRCLAQMWAEDKPPEGVEACKAKYRAKDTACFLAHGHWINMSEPGARAVSCGFYDMGNNTFWMNQDFVGM